MLFDAHCHLDRYEEPLDIVMDQIRRHRILTISTSLDLPSYERNREIAQTCELIVPTFGVHPWNAHDYCDRLGELEEAIDLSWILGEIGLDYRNVADASKYSAQRRVFGFFLSAAYEKKMLVNVDTSGAERDIMDLLGKYTIDRAIVHWYSGPLDVFNELVAFGAYFTIGVEVLYSDHIKAIARKLPTEIMLT